MDALSMTALFLAAVAAVLSARVFLDTRGLLDRPDTAPPPAYDDRAVLAALDHHDDRIDAIRGELQSLAEKVSDQTLAIAEGIERTDRAERRVRAAIGRARSRMEAAGYHDEGLEAEADQLQFFDGGERPSEGVPAMPADMGGAEEVRDMSVFPGEW